MHSDVILSHHDVYISVYFNTATIADDKKMVIRKGTTQLKYGVLFNTRDIPTKVTLYRCLRFYSVILYQ